MEKLLIVAVVVMAVIAVAQLVRVYEAAARLRNKKEEEISERDNKFNAMGLLAFCVLFLGSVVFMIMKYGDGGLPESASEHGKELDWLMAFNMWTVLLIFFVINILLFGFAFKYQYSKTRKALYFPHNNKLELIWTVIPAIFLTIIVIYGLKTWNEITDVASEDSIKIELYSKQFDWTARYGGSDNVLGEANVLLIASDNPLGVVTNNKLDARMKEMHQEIEELKSIIHDNKMYEACKMKLESPEMDMSGGHDSHNSHGNDHGDHDEHGDGTHGSDHGGHGGHAEEKLVVDLEDCKKNVEKYRLAVVSHKKLANLEDKYAVRKRQMATLKDLKASLKKQEIKAGGDDMIIKGEFHIPVGKEISFQFRSQDVIHSAYMPHFRAQMNTVPGMKTYFKFTPTITTAEMRAKYKEDKPEEYKRLYSSKDLEFNYILLCNKICGSNHYNMQMNIVVDTEEDYQRWLRDVASAKMIEADAGTSVDDAKSLAITKK